MRALARGGMVLTLAALLASGCDGIDVTADAGPQGGSGGGGGIGGMPVNICDQSGEVCVRHLVTFSNHFGLSSDVDNLEIVTLNDFRNKLSQASALYRCADRADDVACSVALDIADQENEPPDFIPPGTPVDEDGNPVDEDGNPAGCDDQDCLDTIAPPNTNAVRDLLEETETTFLFVRDLGACSRVGEQNWEGPAPLGCARLNGPGAVVVSTLVIGDLDGDLRRVSIPEEVLAHEFGHIQGLNHTGEDDQERFLNTFLTSEERIGPLQYVVDQQQCNALKALRNDDEHNETVSLEEMICQ